MVRTGSGNILVFSKNVEKQAEFETNELEFLEGDRKVFILNKHVVDAYKPPLHTVPRNINIPKSGNIPQLPRELLQRS